MIEVIENRLQKIYKRIFKIKICNDSCYWNIYHLHKISVNLIYSYLRTSGIIDRLSIDFVISRALSATLS